MDIKYLHKTFPITLRKELQSSDIERCNGEIRGQLDIYFFTWNTLHRIKITATTLSLQFSNSRYASRFLLLLFPVFFFFFFSFWKECSVDLQVQLWVYYRKVFPMISYNAFMSHVSVLLSRNTDVLMLVGLYLLCPTLVILTIYKHLLSIFLNAPESGYCSF